MSGFIEITEIAEIAEITQILATVYCDFAEITFWFTCIFMKNILCIVSLVENGGGGGNLSRPLFIHGPHFREVHEGGGGGNLSRPFLHI